MYAIYAIQISDVKEIADLHKKCFHEHWSADSFTNLLKLDTTYGWNIKSANGNIIGVLIISYLCFEAEIITIFTHPEIRNKGIATQLIIHCFTYLKETRANKILLEVNAKNQNAISLYTKMAFIPIAIRKNYYKNKDNKELSDAVVMQHNFCYN